MYLISHRHVFLGVGFFMLMFSFIANSQADDYGKTAQIGLVNMNVSGETIKAENLQVIQIGMSRYFSEDFAFKLEVAASANPDTGFSAQSDTVNDPIYGRLYETLDLNVSLKSYISAGIKTDIVLSDSTSLELAASLAYIDLEVVPDLTLHAPDYGNQSAGECDVVYYCPNYGSTTVGAVFNAAFFAKVGQKSSLYVEYKKYPDLSVDKQIKGIEPKDLRASSLALGYQSYF